MKTFDRATFEQASAAWADGDFGVEWAPYRDAAALAGFIYPPQGTSVDQVDEDGPSQRAIIHRAIEDTPVALMDAILGSRGWRDVVMKLFGWYEQREAEVLEEERQAAARKAELEPTKDEAAGALARIGWRG